MENDFIGQHFVRLNDSFSNGFSFHRQNDLLEAPNPYNHPANNPSTHPLLHQASHPFSQVWLALLFFPSGHTPALSLTTLHLYISILLKIHLFLPPIYHKNPSIHLYLTYEGSQNASICLTLLKRQEMA